MQAKDFDNPVINACFLLLFKDLIKLYACYNDGIINLLGEKRQQIYHNEKQNKLVTIKKGTNL